MRDTAGTPTITSTVSIMQQSPIRGKQHAGVVLYLTSAFDAQAPSQCQAEGHSICE